MNDYLNKDSGMNRNSLDNVLEQDEVEVPYTPRLGNSLNTGYDERSGIETSLSTSSDEKKLSLWDFAGDLCDIISQGFLYLTYLLQ